MYRILAPAICLGLLFFGCTKHETKKHPKPDQQLSPDVRIVATVNGEPITLAEFQERFVRAGYRTDTTDPSPSPLAVKEEFLNRLVERKMLVREAQRLRISVRLPAINERIAQLRRDNQENIKDVLASEGIDFEKWKTDIWEQLMVEHLIAREVNRKVSVSSAEVRRYYRDHPEEFQRPAEVHARQIVLASEEDAQAVLKLVQAPGADFAAIARSRSTAPEAAEGGDLGWFAQGEMPPQFNVVFGLAKGGISGIVKSPYGYHIFKLVARREKHTVPLKEAYSTIAAKIRKKKEDARYTQWLTALRKRTKFVMNYDALKDTSQNQEDTP